MNIYVYISRTSSNKRRTMYKSLSKKENRRNSTQENLKIVFTMKVLEDGRKVTEALPLVSLMT